MIIVGSLPCPNCGRVLILEVDQAGFESWKAGTVIQQALPDLNKDEREALITGYCTPCWNELFKEDEDGCEVEHK